MHCSSTKLDLSCLTSERGDGSPAESLCGWTPLLQMHPALNTHTQNITTAGKTSVPCQHRKLLNQIVSTVIYGKPLTDMIELNIGNRMNTRAQSYR